MTKIAKMAAGKLASKIVALIKTRQRRIDRAVIKLDAPVKPAPAILE